MLSDVLAASSIHDLRCGVRFPLRLALTVRHNGEDFVAESQNISSAGALFRIDHSISVGEIIDFTISMPGRVLRAQNDVLVDCTGRVVRCSPVGDGYDVAAIIDEYRFQR